MSDVFPPATSYATRWTRWGPADPVAEAAGVSFYSGPAGDIVAPKGKICVCAYHVDRDEAPTCGLLVGSLAEALHVGEHLAVARGGWNVDFVTLWDEHGKNVGTTCPWA